MTELLQKAIDKINTLPEDLQNEVAGRLFEDIESELKWSESFNKSKDILTKLGDKAMAEHEAGKTKNMGFDEL